MSDTPLLDCIVVGGGAAGLSAAIYLGRFRRHFLVLDGGASRLQLIPTSHNYPGFAKGVPGSELLARMQAQAQEYGTPVVNATVERLEKTEDGNFIAHCGQRQFAARTVILATGVHDVEPPGFAEVRHALAHGHLRYCPICDGFEAIGKRVAVIGRGTAGMGEAVFVRHFAHEVTLFSIAEPPVFGAQERERLERAQVMVAASPLRSLSYDEDRTMLLQTHEGAPQRFDVVYSALGTLVNGGLAQVLGARATDDGELFVDSHQQTSVDGLYAAGDIVAGLNQIAVAMGHAAIATTAIHNRLRD